MSAGRQFAELRRARLANQGLAQPVPAAVAEVVERFVAVQGQDYRGSLWGIGQRVAGATAAEIETAANRGEIVRTWPLRGTLHWAAAPDVRWLLALGAPRVLAAHHERLARQFEITPELLRRARNAALAHLTGSGGRTRQETYRAFAAAGISTAGSRGLHILWCLAQDGLVCFGPRRGKQPTLVLLDEWVAPARRRDRGEALGELARRYFTSRGPATLEDYIWWSGLQRADALAGLESAKRWLVEEIAQGRPSWRAAAAPRAPSRAPRAHLLPPYDEYLVAYQDRSAALDPADAARPDAGHGIFYPAVLDRGRMVGTWRRVGGRRDLAVEIRPFAPLAAAALPAIRRAARSYGDFLERPVDLRLARPAGKPPRGRR